MIATATTRFGPIMLLSALLYALAGACSAATVYDTTLDSVAVDDTAVDDAAVDDKESNDSLEGMNRAFYGINDAVDKVLVKPIAKGYVEYVPGGIRTGVSNFFDNLAYVGVVINDVMQGKMKLALKDTGRFLVNTTLGIGGLFDPATSMGLEGREEDFGQTLGTWGAGEGAYLVLPALGSSSARDVPGTVMGFFTNLLYYFEAGVFVPLFALHVIDYRAEMIEASDVRDKSLDPYGFARDAYRQRREYLIYDGNPPLDEENYILRIE